MKIKIGQTYKTQGGGVVRINKKCDEKYKRRNMFRGEVVKGVKSYPRGMTYNFFSDGTWVGGEKNHPLHITEIYKEEKPKKEQPKKHKIVWKKKRSSYPWGKWRKEKVAA